MGAAFVLHRVVRTPSGRRRLWICFARLLGRAGTMSATLAAMTSSAPIYPEPAVVAGHVR